MEEASEVGRRLSELHLDASTSEAPTSGAHNASSSLSANPHGVAVLDSTGVLGVCELQGPHILRLHNGRLFVVEANGVTERNPDTGTLIAHRSQRDLDRFPPAVHAWCEALVSRWYDNRCEDDGEKSDQWFQ